MVSCRENTELPPGRNARAFAGTSLGLGRCVSGCFFFFEEEAMKRYLNYFTPGEYALWGISAAAIVVSHLLFQGGGGVLLPAGGAAHGEPGPQHRIRDHQLLGGVSDLPPQCLVRRRLCRQRPGADRPVEHGRGGGSCVSVGGGVLCRLPGRGPVRLCQLAADAQAAGDVKFLICS